MGLDLLSALESEAPIVRTGTPAPPRRRAGETGVPLMRCITMTWLLQ